MKRKRIVRFFLLAVVASCLNCQYPAKKNIASELDTVDRETLFQVSTVQALLAGSFEGDKTIGELKLHGNFGIGMLNGLDGEIILLDGLFYQAKSDGQVAPLADGSKTPFAVVTFFEADDTLSIEKNPDGFAALRKNLSTLITDKNAFYAIKIEGQFASIKMRSVPAQNKPYRKLLEVFKTDQKIQDFKNVRGTLVGFWFPVYSGGFSIARYHFHFISRNRKIGGHVLDCTLSRGTVEVDLTPNIHFELLSKNNQE